MNQFLPIFFVIFTLNACFAQDKGAEKELYVINILGSKLYEKPSFNSKILGTVAPGKFVKVEEVINTNESQEIGSNFCLDGNWIRTGKEGATGYLFSADLSARDPKIMRGGAGEPHLNLLGDLREETSETKKIQAEQGEFPKYIERRLYENGTSEITLWDGCFNRLTQYRNLDLNEVYHQMISDYSGITSEGEYMLPPPVGSNGRTIKFEGIELTQDLQINIGDEIIIVSSYDCM